MKKKINFTSLLGLIIELASLLLMLTMYLMGREVPQAICYMFLCGLLITIAGAATSIYSKKK